MTKRPGVLPRITKTDISKLDSIWAFGQREIAPFAYSFGEVKIPFDILKIPIIVLYLNHISDYFSQRKCERRDCCGIHGEIPDTYSQSGKNYSMEELKKLNAGDLTTARQGERYIQVTEKNWLAVLSLLERISSQQLNLRTAFDLLLSKEEAQEQLNDLYSEAEEFVQQAGRLSESFASGAERLTMNARTSIGTMEDSAKRSLQDMVRETNEKIYDLTQESRRLMVTQSVVTVALTVLSIVLVTLFALWKVR